MNRFYDHKPDFDFVEDQYGRRSSGIERVRATIERLNGSKQTTFDTGVSTALDAARYGWALGQPVDVLRSHLQQAVDWINDSLDRWDDLDSISSTIWLTVPSLAGDWSTGERVAKLIPEAVEQYKEESPVGYYFMIGLTHLVLNDLNAAAQAGAQMTKSFSSPKTSPNVAETHEALDLLLIATATRNQEQLDAAIVARCKSLARTYGRSVEQRRHVDGLLDMRGVAVVACAHRGDLLLPQDNAYLGVELIVAGSNG